MSVTCRYPLVEDELSAVHDPDLFDTDEHFEGVLAEAEDEDEDEDWGDAERDDPEFTGDEEDDGE